VTSDSNGRKVVGVLAAASALLLVAVIVLAVLAVKWHGDADDAKDETAAGRSALAQAEKDLVMIGSYSYKNGAADYPDFFDQLSSPKLVQTYTSSAKGFQKAIVGSHTVAKASVVDAAYRVVDTHQVEVLAFVDQVMTSNADKGRVNVDQQRVRMTMKQLGGQWKIDNFELLTHAAGR
jgi:hypothetical protein